MEGCGGVQQQLRVLHSAGLEPQARRLCYAANQVLLAPLTLDAGQPLAYCGGSGAAFAATFPLLLVGVGTLQLSYLQERGAKLRHLRELRGAAGRSPGGRGGRGGALLAQGVRVWAVGVVACGTAVAWTEAAGWS